MAFIYRASLGRNLTAAEGDANFTEAETRLAALESERPQPDGFASVSLVGSQLSFYLVSGTQLGPVTIPMPRWRSRGEWLPFTIYAALDIISVEDFGLYEVLLDHTSAATFDPDAVSGGDPIYHLLVPAGVNLSFGGLADVTVTGAADNDFVAWDAGASLWTNRTTTAVTALLDEFEGDVGSPGGGVKGLVPAPMAGDTAEGRKLDASGFWLGTSDRDPAVLPLDYDSLIEVAEPSGSPVGSPPSAYAARSVSVTDLLSAPRLGVLFASLPSAASVPGATARITDSNTATWGATIAGGGANDVLGWSNGTNWTVLGK